MASDGASPFEGRLRRPPQGDGASESVSAMLVSFRGRLLRIHRSKQALDEAIDRGTVDPAHHRNQVILLIDIDHVGAIAHVNDRG